MTHAVAIQRWAESDLDETYLGLMRRRSEPDADRWLAQVYRLLATLNEMPERCGLAFESRASGEPVRHLLIGEDRDCYRALFLVRGRNVYVLRVRYASRRPLGKSGLHLSDIKHDGDAANDR